VTNEDVLCFTRHDPASGQTCLVALNFSSQAQISLTGWPGVTARRLFSSSAAREALVELDSLRLAPHEVLVVERG